MKEICQTCSVKGDTCKCCDHNLDINKEFLINKIKEIKSKSLEHYSLFLSLEDKSCCRLEEGIQKACEEIINIIKQGERDGREQKNCRS